MSDPKRAAATNAAVMAYLTAYITENGYAPSTREIGAAVGLSSLGGVRTVLGRLEDEGRIKVTRGVGRGISITQQRKRRK